MTDSAKTAFNAPIRKLHRILGPIDSERLVIEGDLLVYPTITRPHDNHDYSVDRVWPDLKELIVLGDCTITSPEVSRLPQCLRVAGRLIIQDTNVEELSADLMYGELHAVNNRFDDVVPTPAPA